VYSSRWWPAGARPPRGGEGRSRRTWPAGGRPPPSSSTTSTTRSSPTSQRESQATLENLTSVIQTLTVSLAALNTELHAMQAAASFTKPLNRDLSPPRTFRVDPSFTMHHHTDSIEQAGVDTRDPDTESTFTKHRDYSTYRVRADSLFIVRHYIDVPQATTAIETEHRDQAALDVPRGTSSDQNISDDSHRYRVLRALIAETPKATGLEILEVFLDDTCETDEELQEAIPWGLAALRVLGYDVEGAEDMESIRSTSELSTCTSDDDLRGAATAIASTALDDVPLCIRCSLGAALVRMPAIQPTTGGEPNAVSPGRSPTSSEQTLPTG
jgi:hypothetical protein